MQGRSQGLFRRDEKDMGESSEIAKGRDRTNTGDTGLAEELWVCASGLQSRLK